MKYWKVALAGALVVLPIAAIAASPGNGPGFFGWGHHGGGHGMGFGHDGFPGPRMIEMLQGMDADRDGVISAEEFGAGHADHLGAADTDGDGGITQAELEEFVIARVREHVGERFARMDADGDGTISAEEMAARWDDRFARMDNDGDGNLTIHDLPARGDRGGPDAMPEAPSAPAEEAPAE